jgi:S-adenosylmethionine:tRNA ribosyltransferase-isomerase
MRVYTGSMRELDQWDYTLPNEAIARYPTQRRQDARLMVVERETGETTDGMFSQLMDWVKPGDLLVANNTRVMAARLFGHRSTGGKVEFLVLEANGHQARALAKPAKKLKDGEWVALSGGGRVRMDGRGEAPGECLLWFEGQVMETMEAQGVMPLPPYLRREAEASDRQRYQTVYAGPLGAAAAPTAGLHFTQDCLNRLRDSGVGFQTVTLHVGVGTFRPVTEADLERGRLHVESYEVPQSVCAAVAEARRTGRRVIAVGTTSLRALEAATGAGERVPTPGKGTTDLFIRPGYVFRCVDGLLTNFHLPRSSLLMLVGSLAGQSTLLSAYDTAVKKGYRFYSYGDAMLLL